MKSNWSDDVSNYTSISSLRSLRLLIPPPTFAQHSPTHSSPSESFSLVNPAKNEPSKARPTRSECFPLYAANGLPPTGLLTLPMLLQRLEFMDEFNGEEGDGTV